MIRLLKLNDGNTWKRELTEARVNLAEAALAELGSRHGQEVDHLKYEFLVQRDAASDRLQCRSLEQYRAFGLAAIGAERRALERLRTEDRVGIDMYLLLQEELDWSELTMLSERDRRIVEA